MFAAILVALLIVTSSCGSDTTQRNTRSTTEMDAAPIYDLHEWGLVTTSARGFELAAGPGQGVTPEEMMVADKPILYVHATAAFDLEIEVTPRSGLSFTERWPPMVGTSWTAAVRPEPCRGQHAYPQSCSAPDGYCEVAELALYETEDAACLRVGEHSLPLLFYRMRHAEGGPTMPLRVQKDGDQVSIENASWADGVGAVWRVSWDGNTGQTHAAHVAIPSRGERATLARPTRGGVGEAREAIRADLGSHGLTASETDAFMRAWDEALFGASTTDTRTPEDGVGADEPVQVNDVLVNDETDRLSDSENIPAIQGGPRIADVVLYWLPRNDIDALAEVSARPAPRNLRRAILVRADVR